MNFYTYIVQLWSGDQIIDIWDGKLVTYLLSYARIDKLFKLGSILFFVYFNNKGLLFNRHINCKETVVCLFLGEHPKEIGSHQTYNYELC